LEVEVKDVVMDTVPAKAGKYHESFFDYILTVLKNARIRVESSASWMQELSGKKPRKVIGKTRKNTEPVIHCLQTGLLPNKLANLTGPKVFCRIIYEFEIFNYCQPPYYRLKGGSLTL